MSSVKLSPQFQKACDEVGKLKQSPENEDLLKLYCLFKTGRQEDFSKATQPGRFDLKGKAKYNAWKDFDRSMAPGVAQKKYVDLVEELKSSIGMK